MKIWFTQIGINKTNLQLYTHKMYVVLMNYFIKNDFRENIICNENNHYCAITLN